MESASRVMASPSDVSNGFDLYDDRSQPNMLIEGYRQTWLRVPTQPPYRRPLTRTEISGPLKLARKLEVGNNDLSRVRDGAPRAVGQLIYVAGRLLDEDGRPVRKALIEIWQANAAGRYLHTADAGNPAPIDPNFIGTARILTDEEGRYQFLTIKPGAYPTPDHPARWWRPPHIHLSVFGEGFMSRLVTQMYFPGEPLNEEDLLLNSVPDPKGRERLIAKLIPMLEMPTPHAIGYGHDLVVRGHRQTPFLG